MVNKTYSLPKRILQELQKLVDGRLPLHGRSDSSDGSHSVIRIERLTAQNKGSLQTSSRASSDIDILVQRFAMLERLRPGLANGDVNEGRGLISSTAAIDRSDSPHKSDSSEFGNANEGLDGEGELKGVSED